MSYFANNERPTATLTRANAYFAARPHSEDWTSASTADRTNALASASLFLDAAFLFAPNAASRDAEGNLVWNERVIAALCEQALWTLRLDASRYPEILAQGVARVSVADVAATLKADVLAPIIAPSAKRLIGNLGVFIADDGGGLACTPLAL